MTAPKKPSTAEQFTALHARLDDLRHLALNPRPVEVRHVHEKPPKPFSVSLRVMSPEGITQHFILTEGSGWDLPAQLTEQPAEQPRRWWQRRPAARRFVAPVRIDVIDIK